MELTHSDSTVQPTIRGSAVLARRSARRRAIGPLVGYLVLTAGACVMILPFFWLVSTSLTAHGLEFQVPPQWIPDPIVWRNYYTAFFQSGLPFQKFVVNTTIIAVANVVGTLLSASLAGFGFARLRFPARDYLFILVLSTMMLPGIVTLIPSYLLFNKIGWVDTWLPLIVPSYLGGGALYVFLFRQFFMGLPLELDEAARMDGASTWQIFGRIALPLSGPILATVGIFAFMGSWNDFLDSLIYLNTLDKMTLAVGLQSFRGFHGSEWNLMMAAAIMMIAPVLILFFLAQRYFVKGIHMSGLTGR
jgi:multiple sugar transport system permease protein